MDNQARLEAIAHATDVNDFQEHVGWTLTVLPNLLKRKDLLTSALIASVLTNTPANYEGREITKEQLAGYVSGIDYIIKFFQDTMKKGEKALRDFADQGIHITDKDL